MLSRQVKGFAFRLTGLILGVVGVAVVITAIVFSAIGLHKAAEYKNFPYEEEFR